MRTAVYASRRELAEIREILERRANEVASYQSEYQQQNPTRLGSVELALTREIDRLRSLASSIDPDADRLTDD